MAPLRKIADSFKELANVMNQTGDVKVAAFAGACTAVSPLIDCLGEDRVFKLAKSLYVAAVKDLQKVPKSQTLRSMTDSSHKNNLLTVKRILGMVKVFFEQILTMNGNSLREAASNAYTEVLAPYHDVAIRNAVIDAISKMPTKQELLRKLNENESSAKDQMREYVAACAPLLQ